MFWEGYLKINGGCFHFPHVLFARPFSYKTNLSSGDRESPVRDCMGHILIKTERDMEEIITFNSRKINNSPKFLKADLGIFNDPVLSSATDYDSHKFIIGRVSIKPQYLGKNITPGAAASGLYNGLSQNTKYVFATQYISGNKNFVVDSSAANVGNIAPGEYFGVDEQLKIENH